MTYCMVCNRLLILHPDSLDLKLVPIDLNVIAIIGRKGVQGAQPGPTLDWIQRVRIAVDAARGWNTCMRRFNLQLYIEISGLVTCFSLKISKPR